MFRFKMLQNKCSTSETSIH